MSASSVISIQGSVVTPSSPDYEKALDRRSATSVLRAALVTYPESPADVSSIVKFVRSQTPPLELAVKGGGCHPSTASSTNGGIVIDLSRLNYVKVSTDKTSIKVGGGALWGEVYSEIAKYNLIVVGGNVWNVGVGGFLLGGGYSNFSGFYGLGADNILEATIVLADGSIVTCSEANEPDIFWAIRGAGSQFGVVTEFILKAYPSHGPALTGALAYPGTQLTEVLAVLREYLVTKKPSHIILAFSRAPPEFHPSILLLPYIEGTKEEAEAALIPFKTAIKPVFAQTDLAPNFNAVSHSADAFLEHAPPRAVSQGALFTDIWEDTVGQVFDDWMKFTENEEFRQSMILWELYPAEKIADVKEEDTAYPARKPHYYIMVYGRYSFPENDPKVREWASAIICTVNQANKEKEGFVFPTPINFAIGTEKPEDVYGVNLPRLQKLKAKYDPAKVFGKLWSIEPVSN